MQSQEVAVRPNVRVVLKSDSELLEEVIVVAYGTATKESLTGSVSTVKADAIEKISTASFEKALQGQTAGLQVGSTSGQPGTVSQVRIRGIGSMSASSTPLYVIDGVAISSKNISKVADEDSYGTS
ncbi:MAG: TonB-dependent receptor plug domain-containing protein, partial [Mediterranea sp.]|nr:TonB-dependent receptor plug domain-containing protein [Mediterranea sp.]